MSARARRLSTRVRVLSAAGAALLIAGVIAIVVAVQAQQAAPQPPASAAAPAAVTPTPWPPSTPADTRPASQRTSPSSTPSASNTSTSRHPQPTPTVRGPILPRAIPTHLSVPAIDVDKDLKKIGLADDGRIQSPPLVQDSHPYWLTVSPTPGELGPAVIIGHVDSAAYGPGIFFDLGDLRQHDKIHITRADHTVAVFAVTHVNSYSKAHFPTNAVYGNTDHAALRLITCGGEFNESRNSYDSNIVAYAALVSSHPT